jgi:hypothetical protein
MSIGMLFFRRGSQANPTLGSEYIKFADEEVLRVLMANGVSSDGAGVTKDDALKVTSFETWFANNTAVTSFNEINYFERVTTIPSGSFSGCTSLEIEEVRLPNLESIGSDAFKGVKIRKWADMGKITSLPKVANATNIYNTLGDPAYLEEVILPDSLAELPTNMFKGYSSLTSISFPPSLTSIGRGAFENCTALPSILRLDYVENIGLQAFRNCTSLQEVYLPNVVTIDDGSNYRGSFAQTNITLLKIGSRCTGVGSFLRAYSSNSILLTFICEAVEPPTFGSYPFHGGGKMANVYVPDESVEAYKTAMSNVTGWSTYTGNVKPLSEYQG